MSDMLEDIYGVLRAYKRSRALAVILSSGLLESLRQREATIEMMADRCGMDPEWAKTLVSISQGLGLVTCSEANGGAAWSLTEKGCTALDDTALNAFAVYHLYCFEGWEKLADKSRRKDGGPGFHRLGMRDPQFAKAYVASMEALTISKIALLKIECPIQGAVLDIGSGPSTFCRSMAADGGCSVTAVDFPEIVEAAESLFNYPAGFTWMKADLNEFETTQHFDWVYAGHLVEYVSARSLVDWIRKIKSFLKPGGRLAMLSFLRESSWAQQSDLDLFELSTGINGDCLGRVQPINELTGALSEEGAIGVSCRALSRGPSYSEFLITCQWK